MLPTVADVLALEPVRRGAPRVLTGRRPARRPGALGARHRARRGRAPAARRRARPVHRDRAAARRRRAGQVRGRAGGGRGQRPRRRTRLPLRQRAAARAGHGGHRSGPAADRLRAGNPVHRDHRGRARPDPGRAARGAAGRPQRLHQVFTDLALAGRRARTRSSLARPTWPAVPVILADLAHRVLACAPGRARTSRPCWRASRPGPGGDRRRAAIGLRRHGRLAGGQGRIRRTATGVGWCSRCPDTPDAGAPVLAERTATTLTLASLARSGDGRRARSGRRISPCSPRWPGAGTPTRPISRRGSSRSACRWPGAVSCRSCSPSLARSAPPGRRRRGRRGEHGGRGRRRGRGCQDLRIPGHRRNSR